MEVIPSFAVDHTNLQPGIYVSRTDIADETPIVTYDIRITAPNAEPAVNVAAMHTIEHLVATYLRNLNDWKDNIIYWGPMGCMTGCYFIVKGAYKLETIRQLMIEAFEFVANYEGDVPGNTPATCGNCLMHDLPMAKYEAKRYVNRLRNAFCCDYPGVERPMVGNGKLQFFDA